MRIALLSDIHANLHALRAVEKDLEQARVDRIWCLGDVVGYGANPVEVLEWVELRTHSVVKGNHDEAVSSGEMTWFNPMAAAAARLHAHLLTPPQRNRIFQWPETICHRLEHDPSGGSAAQPPGESFGSTVPERPAIEVLLVHASPDDPLHEYIQLQDAAQRLESWHGQADVVVLGHTHRPFAAVAHPCTGARWSFTGFQQVHEHHSGPTSDRGLLVLNPGSVGQPRDGDPRASYAVLDAEARTVELRRVPYDFGAASDAIARAGLDAKLGMRLHQGH